MPETATVVEPGSIGHFEVSDVKLSTDDDGHEAVVGTVTTHFAETQSNAWMTAVFRDPSGEIVHVDDGGLFDDVPPGADFEASVLMDAPDGTVPEVFVVPDPMVQDPELLRAGGSS